MATTFYRTGSEMLARERDGYPPEIFHETTRQWAPFPELDPYHDAEVISREEAVKTPEVPISMGDLESTGDTGNFGDIYEGEQRAPLRQ